MWSVGSMVYRLKSENKWYLEGKETTLDDTENVTVDPETNASTSSNCNVHKEMKVTLFPFSPHPDIRQNQEYPYHQWHRNYFDNRMTIYFGRLKYLRHMGLSEKNLMYKNKGGNSYISIDFITSAINNNLKPSLFFYLQWRVKRIFTENKENNASNLLFSNFTLPLSNSRI